MRGTWWDLEVPSQVASVGEAFQVLEQSGIRRVYCSEKHLGRPVDPSGCEFLMLFIPFDGSLVRFL